MSLDEKFQAACNRIKKFTKKPQDSEMLELYGLYKQATFGNKGTTAEPSDQIGRAKLSAWKGKNGLTPEQSKEMYVKKVEELSKKLE